MARRKNDFILPGKYEKLRYTGDAGDAVEKVCEKFQITNLSIRQNHRPDDERERNRGKNRLREFKIIGEHTRREIDRLP